MKMIDLCGTSPVAPSPVAATADENLRILERGGHSSWRVNA